MTKITIVHHSADFDGIFCREIPKKFLLNNVTTIGWDYRDQKIPFPKEGIVYVLDLSPSCFAELPVDFKDRLIWIDHHKTSIDEWGDGLLGYRIDGVAACRLAWQWFSQTGFDNPISDPVLPVKEDFVNRIVKEPYAVRLAGEYDIWDKRDANAELFQHGLRSEELTPDLWRAILCEDANADLVTLKLLAQGRAIQFSQQKADAGTMQRSFIVAFERLNFLALNTARCNSLTFASKDLPETGHDALMGYYYDGKKWNYSLYHAKHRTDLDLSEIAKKYGGGGHRGACGFQRYNQPIF